MELQTKFHVGATIIGAGIALVEAVYMITLRVPSVLSIRPELADVGLVTGIFSGRGTVYLYHNFPVVTAVLFTALSIIAANLFVWMAIR